MDLQLTGKVAAITGSSRGLGYASAKALVAEGCHVAISARGAERLEEAAVELRTSAQHGAKVAAILADVSTSEGCTRLSARR